MDTRYIGNTSQLFDVRQYRFEGGRAEGTRAIDVWNGGALSFTVLPDRALDIYTLRYRGVNLAFHTPSGVVSPYYYSDISAKWLRSFGGGFFVTCGLQSIGNADGDDPELSVHGRISNTPAESLCVDVADDGQSVKISSIMREGVLFGSKLKMKREIFCARGEDKISIVDTVTNLGYTRDAISMLYHFNMGWPLLSEDAVPYIPAERTIPRNEHAASDMKWDKVLSPAPAFEEMCYYHFLRENVIGIDNPALNIGLRVAFSSPILDRAVQWRMFGEGDYVMGLEPASCSLEGRTNAISDGSQKYIEARDKIVNRLTITFGDAQ